MSSVFASPSVWRTGPSVALAAWVMAALATCNGHVKSLSYTSERHPCHTFSSL